MLQDLEKFKPLAAAPTDHHEEEVEGWVEFKSRSAIKTERAAQKGVGEQRSPKKIKEDPSSSPCYLCGRLNHSKGECKLRLTCFLCRLRSHLASGCPARARGAYKAVSNQDITIWGEQKRGQEEEEGSSG